jgi:hypothetical protein
MNASHLEVLSRFFDGEEVDPALLAESLADPDAVGYLAQCAALRAWVREDDSRPSDRFYETMHRRLKSIAWRQTWWSRLARPAVAAGLLLAGGAIGYQYRSGVGSPRGAAVVSPRTDVVRESVPHPTSQLRFVLWRETEPSKGH